MSANTPEQQLHDRATRGEALSHEERAQLDAWYERLDREETAILSGTTPTDLTAVQSQIDAAVGELTAVAQRIQVLTAENAAARQEIAALQRKLARAGTAQTT